MASKIFTSLHQVSFFLRVDSHQRFLVLLQQRVLGVTFKNLNLVKDLLLAVMYQRNRVLFIHSSVMNQLELNNIILTNNLMKFFQVILGMKRMMYLNPSFLTGVQIHHPLHSRYDLKICH